MINSTKIALALFVCAVGLCSLGRADDRAYATEHVARLNKDAKTIDATFGGATIDGKTAGAEQAKLAVMRDRVNLALKNQRLSAQASGTQAQAGQGADTVKAQAAGSEANAMHGAQAVKAVKTGDNAVQAAGHGEKVAASGKNDRAMAVHGRQRAQGALVRDGETVKGGNAAQGGNKAAMTNTETAAQLAANGQYLANAVNAGNNNFNVATQDKQDAASRGRYALASQSLSSSDGAGVVNAKNSEGASQYKYTMSQTDGNEGVAELNQVGGGSGVFDRQVKGWKCTAVKDGESVCRDNNGKIVGKVSVNSQGDASVTDMNGVVIGRGKVNKISEQEYEVEVMEGVALAKTNTITQYDCYNEVMPGGEQTKKVLIENFEVKVNGEKQADGSEAFTWPSCFDVEGDVTVPAGVDPSRLAFEYLGHVMPMGSMKCMDSMTCGRGCYYCNACEKESMISEDASLTMGEGDNTLCSLHGGSGKQRVSMRVCPPETLEKAAFCGGFDRHIIGSDYYKYNGSINAQIRVWLRPENEVALRKTFFTQIGLPLVKTGFQNSYKLENVAAGQLRTPTDNELLEWYVRKNGDDTLLACRRGVIDYSVGGTDVSSNLMIDAFTNLPGKSGANAITLFSDAPCDAWVAQQDAEYAHYQKEFNQDKPAASGLSSVFSNFLGGRGRRG